MVKSEYQFRSFNGHVAASSASQAEMEKCSSCIVQGGYILYFPNSIRESMEHIL